MKALTRPEVQAILFSLHTDRERNLFLLGRALGQIDIMETILSGRADLPILDVALSSTIKTAVLYYARTGVQPPKL